MNADGANVVPRDAALPHLARALDGMAMREVFAPFAQAEGGRLDHCQVDRVTYRPGRNASLSYILHGRDARGERTRQRVAARVCGADGATRAARARSASLVPSRSGPDVTWHEALGVLAWWWPNDPKLPATRVLPDGGPLDGDVLAPVLRAMDAPASCTAHATVAQYVPEHRLTARVDLRWNRGAERAASQARVFAKSCREPASATVHARLVKLGASAAVREGRLRVPQALAYDAAHDIFWQTAVPGTAWSDQPHAIQRAAAARLGEQLAWLHAIDPTSGSTSSVTRDALAAQLARAVEVLAPQVGLMHARTVAARLAAGWHFLDASPIGTVHGDFHARNVLVDASVDPVDEPRNVGLIDVDGLHAGPTLIELGAWLADGRYRALLAACDEAAAADGVDVADRRFLEGYAAAGGTRPAARALAWSMAWTLFAVRACRCVTTLKPGRLALVGALVDLASDFLDTASPRAVQPSAARSLPC